MTMPDPGVRRLRRQQLIAAVAFIEHSLCARHSAEHSTCMNSLHHFIPIAIMSIYTGVPVLKMGKLRHREMQ